MYPVFILITASISTLLGNAEGVYQWESGTYPECLERPFIQVHSDAGTESVLFERLDRAGNSRGWQWLFYGPLDGKKRMVEGFFTIAKYQRFTAKKSGDQVRLRRGTKECNMRFLCGRWQDATEVTLGESAVAISLRDGTERCDYKRVEAR